MSIRQTQVSINRWQGSLNPTMANVLQIMKQEGLRPYTWQNSPNFRYGVRTHNYNKVLYVLDGTIEIHLPDSNQRAVLRSGDRIDIPAGVRHATIVGRAGAKCVEAAMASRHN